MMRTKLKVPIFDSSFLFTGAKANALHCSGERFSDEPEYFNWDKQDNIYTFDNNVWITDACILSETDKIKTNGNKIGWLIEPICLCPNHYEYVRDNRNKFDYILSSNYNFITSLNNNGYKNALWVPQATSFIRLDKWGIKPKSKLCSMILTDKQITYLHKQRVPISELAKKYNVDILGSGTGKWIGHYDAISDYMYHIVVEGCNELGYFSEKVIDCFALGTIPIYKGCETSLNLYFDGCGIIQFNELSELKGIFREDMNEVRYHKKVTQDAVLWNYELAGQYYTTEDWIYKHYPQLFDYA